jgi:hypothetical protein
VHGRVLTEVPLQADDAYTPVGSMGTLNLVPGAVGRSVVDEQQLEGLAVQSRHGPAHEVWQGPTLVVERHHD